MQRSVAGISDIDDLGILRKCEAAAPAEAKMNEALSRVKGLRRDRLLASDFKLYQEHGRLVRAVEAVHPAFYLSRVSKENVIPEGRTLCRIGPPQATLYLGARSRGLVGW